jgi:hypothetical protein
LTIPYCTGMHWWKGQQYAAGYLGVSSDNIILHMHVLIEDNNIPLDILVFFWQYHIVEVCIKGEGQYYAAGYLSVS